MRQWRRAQRLQRETDGLRHRIEGRTGSLGRRFDRTCDLLTARAYLDDDQATSAGRVLSRLWSEADLVVAETVQAGIWDALDPAELAAAASVLVYEPRREETPVERYPTVRVRDAVAATGRVWADVAAAETAGGLPTTREPEAGFAWPVWRWARGEHLDSVLTRGDGHGTAMPAGDFVRWVKQVLDLLDQLSGLREALPTLAATAGRSADLLRRGIVRSSTVG